MERNIDRTSYRRNARQEKKEVIPKSNNKFSLLEINIETGRKNQIRVQLNNIGHPILGDNKYGKDNKYKRLMLHASKLIIKISNNKTLIFESTIPKYFHTLISK